MVDNTLKHISESKEYKDLVETRKKVTRPLTFLMLGVYYFYILIIAFSPETLAQPIGDGPTTTGIVVGLGIIFSSFVITGIAVHKSNTELEPLTEKVHELAKKGE